MDKKIEFNALTALVLSSMLGAGVFSLPQTLVAVAGPTALIIGWLITGVGILFLAYALILLSHLKPDLDSGIFNYAREGFGNLTGFCAAWGYWLCAVIANTSYLVIVFSALSFFTDSPNRVIFAAGNSWQAIICASVILWIVHFQILRGISTAAKINLFATLGKLIPLVLFIILNLFVFDTSYFCYDFLGTSLGTPLSTQIKQTMLITLWVFIGIEGAVVVSSRARNKRDVGRATLLAVVSALTIYLLITLLPLAIVPREELIHMANPSMAKLMKKMVGGWGEIAVAIGLVISVCGSYLSWTIMAAEVPSLAAKYALFPAILAHTNRHDAPTASLWLTNGGVQICLILIALNGFNYTTLLTIASEMIILPYLLIGVYLFKIAYQTRNKKALFVSSGTSLYGAWLLFASGLQHLVMSVTLYMPGILLFLWTRQTTSKTLASLNNIERIVIILLLFITLCALYVIY